MKLIPFFRAGKHLDNQGNTVEISDTELDAAIAGYDPALHRAPLVIGHPEDNAPAYGWVRSITRNAEGELAAVPEQVDGEFDKGVEAGTWYPRSASWYAPDEPSNPKPGIYYLRHIGFLGAVPPAVKGLSKIEFNENDNGLEISIPKREQPKQTTLSNSDLWGTFCNWLGEKFGQAEADRLTGKQASDKPVTSSPPAQPAADSALQAENDRLKAELKALESKEDEEEKTARHQANLDFAEHLVVKGMKPAYVSTIVAALDAADGSSRKRALQFVEGDNHKLLSKSLKVVFSDLAGGINFSEQASRDRQGQSGKATTTNPLLADAEARTQK